MHQNRTARPLEIMTDNVGLSVVMDAPSKSVDIIAQDPKISVSKPLRRLSARRLQIIEMC